MSRLESDRALASRAGTKSWSSTISPPDDASWCRSFPGSNWSKARSPTATWCAARSSNFRPTHVVHAAASYKDPTDWREDVETNVLGTDQLSSRPRATIGATRFVNFQTVLCYGGAEQNPIPVDHPLTPFTSYAISKVAGEQYLAASDLSWVSLRLANVTGPRLAIGPIPTFYKRLKAQQPCFCTDAIRDFLDMSDFISAVDLAMAKTDVVGIFNVASGRGRSIKEIYDVVREHLGLGPDPASRSSRSAATTCARWCRIPRSTMEKLGWTPKVDFRTTMQRVLNGTMLMG